MRKLITDKTPDQLKMPYALWTRAAVGHLIEKRFGLTERPALAVHLALAQPSKHRAPEKAMRVLIDLLELERQGRHHEVVQRRKTLRDLHASLYAAYMSTR